MCGGAILAELIPSAPAARRVTAGHVWPGDANKAKKKGARADDFEAAFRDFDNDSDDEEMMVEEAEEEEATSEHKPFVFRRRRRPGHGALELRRRLLPRRRRGQLVLLGSSRRLRRPCDSILYHVMYIEEWFCQASMCSSWFLSVMKNYVRLLVLV
ncbi:Os03g0183300, partial [Oryza sativa Japonica Group]